MATLRTIGLLAVLAALGPAPVRADDEPTKPTQPTIEKVASGYRFTEGPALDAKGAVSFTDIPSERILRYDPETKKTSVAKEDTGRANGLLFDGKGRLLACEGGRRRLVRIDGDVTEVLAERFEDKRLNSPNDLTVDAQDGVYFTDPRYGAQDDRELDFEGVFHCSAEGTLRRVCREAVKPNGIHLALDGKTLYVADSERKLILAYDVKAPGEPSGARVFAKLDADARGGPDGLTINERGDVHCAGQGRIWIWSAAGILRETIEMPESPTNCVFVRAEGLDLSLYVTARTSLYRVTRKAR